MIPREAQTSRRFVGWHCGTWNIAKIRKSAQRTITRPPRKYPREIQPGRLRFPISPIRGLEEIRRSGRQVYRKSVVGRELKILRLRCTRTCCRPSLIAYAVQGFMRQVPVVISYVSRRASARVSVADHLGARARTCICVCVYATNSPRRMARSAFSFREASNDSNTRAYTTLPLPPTAKNKRPRTGNRCESALSGGSRLRTESLTRLRADASRRGVTFRQTRKIQIEIKYVCR